MKKVLLSLVALLATTMSFARTTLWEGTQTFDASWPYVAVSTVATPMSAGDKIIVTVTKADNTINAAWEWGPQVYAKSGWNDCLSVVSLTDGVTNKEVTYTLTADQASQINTAGEIEVQGMNTIIGKVEYDAAQAGGGSGQELTVTFSNIDADGTLTEAGNWWYQSSGLAAPASEDYKYVVVQFTTLTTGGKMMFYGPWYEETEGSGNWVAGHVDKDFTAGTTIIAFSVDEVKALANFNWENSCFVISATPGEKALIKSISFMTEEDYQKAMAADADVEKVKELGLPGTSGSVVMIGESEGGSGWNNGGWIGAENLGQTYKTFVVEVASAQHEFAVIAQNWPEAIATNIEKKVSGTTSPVIVAYTIGDAGELQGLGQYAIQNRYITEAGEPYMDPKTGQQVDGNIYGDNTVVISRAYLTSKEVASTYTPWGESDGIANIAADKAADNVIYNLAGQRVSSAKGLVIKGGKKYLAK